MLGIVRHHVCRRGSCAQEHLTPILAVALHHAGILTRRRDGNQVKYGADRSCTIFPELHRIVLKTTGLAHVLREVLLPVSDRIDVAFVFGSLASGEATADSDVDLMIIGHLGLRELVPLIQQATATLMREINPVTMAPQELTERVAREEHFVARILTEPMIFVIGDDNELERIAQPETSPQT